MRICFLGNSHAAIYLSTAAKLKGLDVVDASRDAHLTFVSQDTPTDNQGNRQLSSIQSLVSSVHENYPVILTSQVPPGFTRSLNRQNVIHQPETLRMMDAIDRAMNPEFIVAGKDPCFKTPPAYLEYLQAFKCQVIWTDWETAEFSKIAINMYLASQVDTTNRLAAAAKKVGADWDALRLAIGYDSRIGKYLTPGRWQDSIHLLRDYVTLKEIEDGSLS